MFKIKKNKFSIQLFVFASLSALIIAGFLYFLLLMNLYVPSSSDIAYEEDNNEASIEYGDLFVTPADPQAMITGPVINENDPSFGAENPAVNIVIYSDYECKYCQEQEKMIKNIMAEHQDKIRFIRKDFPDAKEDSASYQSAMAARCAQKEDRYWAFHDELYSLKDLSKQNIENIVKKLNLKFKLDKCLSNSDIKQAINDNIDEANALDITGVPFIYINNQEIMGKTNKESIAKIISVELSRKKD